MIPESVAVVLDTGVLVHLCRQDGIGSRVAETYGLRSRRRAPLIPAVCAGELLSLARSNNWGPERLQVLEVTLSNMVIVDPSRRSVLEAYADADVLLKRLGAPIGQNDLWVAATARAVNGVLLTTDTDFDRLHPEFLQREWIEQRKPVAGSE